MKNEKFYKFATGIALTIFGILSYDYYQRMNPYQPACSDNKNYVATTIQEWMQAHVSEDILKTNKLEVTDIGGFAEYNTIPQWNNVPLYEDFKHSTICAATVLVDFAPIIKSKESEENKEVNLTNNEHLEEISVRYQLVSKGGIRMSGIDVEDMAKQVNKAMNKHKKK